ncbi:hypothetical protein ABZ208_13685 [Streptomyces sp. NPDC006208]|uniref:hypothetical protein n=1 Tax=Streptomyces sp. NPDC006208 TaxID=3156734 RepID=UPI00339F3531
MSDASQAEKKYTEAVEKSGRQSKEAAEAQAEYARKVAKLPPATRTAVAALSVFKEEYKDWSNSLAGDTMPVVTKSFAVFGGLLPKLTPLVKGTSTELSRMMTILAGGMQSPGFDRLNQKFERFATGTLKGVNDALVRLLRTNDGSFGDGFSKFMAYARAQGPLVGETLRNIGQALMNVLKAGSQVGVGMLQAINALAKLVAAVPPGLITILLQLAVALRVAKLAALGWGAASGAIAAMGAQLVAMRTAAAGTPGRLAALTASIGALSRGAKLALAGTGIGLLVIALTELANIGKKAPTDMDRMATSMGKFAQSGKLSGEAAKVLGSDFREFDEALRGMARPGQWDQMQQGFTNFFGQDSTPVKRWKATLDDADKSLANMVKSGNAEMAAAAFEKLAARAKSQGMTTGELRKELGDYKQAQADARFEQELAAQAMGLFGAQAQSVQAKLDAQKRSTDGLRQSIMALNEVNRAALDGRAGMEAAIDAAAEATKKHGNALKIVNGELDLTSQEARDASGTLTELARKTEENVSSARDSGKSWEYAKGEYDRGRAALIRAADAMGLNKNEARALADQILKTPNKTAYLKGDIGDLQGKLADAKKRLATVPDSRKAKVRAEIYQLEQAIAAARRKLDGLNGKTAHTYVITHLQARKEGVHGTQLGYASGGLVGFPGGGMVRGPGTGTSDSILARVSNGEFVVRAKSVARYGVQFLRAINEGRLGMAAATSGGAMSGAGRDVGRGLAGGIGASLSTVEASARRMAAAVVTGVRGELQISSPSKKMQALAKDVGKGLILGLTGSKAKIAATAKDLAKDIWAAFTGSKDNRLVAMVNRETKKLQDLASKRDGLAKKIADAKKFASDTTTAARQGAELGSLGLDAEEVSAGSIKAGLAQKLAQIRQFTRHIDILAKRGLSKGLLRQILNMGPEAGSAYASALAGADKGTIASINSMQSQIDKSSTDLGRLGADRLYDSGKNAGKGFLKGLTSQQKAIEAQMLKIAKGMDKAIRKALGIKSPSTVMAAVGRFSAEGLARGLIAGGPQVGRAMGGLSGVVAAGVRPARSVGATSRTGQAPVIHIHVDGTVMDPVAVGRQIQRVLKEFQRTQGGTALGLA